MSKDYQQLYEDRAQALKELDKSHTQLADTSNDLARQVECLVDAKRRIIYLEHQRKASVHDEVILTRRAAEAIAACGQTRRQLALSREHYRTLLARERENWKRKHEYEHSLRLVAERTIDEWTGRTTAGLLGLPSQQNYDHAREELAAAEAERQQAEEACAVKNCALNECSNLLGRLDADRAIDDPALVMEAGAVWEAVEAALAPDAGQKVLKERNLLRASVEELLAAMQRYETGMDEELLYQHRQMMQRARRALMEGSRE